MQIQLRELSEDKQKEFKQLMSTLVGNEYGVHSAETIKQLFNWNNDIHPMNKEFARTCGACRAKVWNRCLAYYNTLLSRETTILDSVKEYIEQTHNSITEALNNLINDTNKEVVMESLKEELTIKNNIEEVKPTTKKKVQKTIKRKTNKK